MLVHLACQAYRAHSAFALPEPGPESAPWFVATVLLAVWLPFLAFATRELFAPRAQRAEAEPAPAPAQAQAQRRALAQIEPAALVVVLLFALLHGIQLAWPLLVGRLSAGDARPELIALLSSTQSGLPLQAMAALCAVGAASFYAFRQLQKAFPDARPAFARGLVASGVLSYLLGSYAVIRCASGSLFP